MIYVTETAWKITSVYSQSIITDCQVQNWFSKFHFGDISLKEEPRLGHSSDLDQNALRELVECNPHKRTWELALDLNTSQSTICHHLKKIGKVSKLGVWIPHSLSEKNKEDYILIATSLLSRLKNDLFLKNIITGEKKKRSFMTMFNAKG